MEEGGEVVGEGWVREELDVPVLPVREVVPTEVGAGRSFRLITSSGK